jgi:hypothetical protein
MYNFLVIFYWQMNHSYHECLDQKNIILSHVFHKIYKD